MGIEALGDPFGPGLVMWDVLRVYSALGSILVTVGGLVQLFHPLPGLTRRVRRSRAVHILGTVTLLLGLSGGNVVRMGYPPTVPPVLVCTAAGVTVLLLWLLCERRARREPASAA